MALKIYICDDADQAAILIEKWGKQNLVDTGPNPQIDSLIVTRDKAGTQTTIKNYTGEGKYVLVFK